MTPRPIAKEFVQCSCLDVFMCGVFLSQRPLSVTWRNALQVEEAKRKRDGQSWSAEEQAEFKRKISSRLAASSLPSQMPNHLHLQGTLAPHAPPPPPPTPKSPPAANPTTWSVSQCSWCLHLLLQEAAGSSCQHCLSSKFTLPQLLKH